jgi:O-antigen ligase
VLTGFALFATVQVLLAQMIVDDKWYFVLELMIAIASLTLMIIKPIYALVVWILFSPLVSRLFSLDWGAGLPAITFNRSVIYPLAIILLMRGLGSRTKIRNLKLGEWLLLAFPFYILCTGPFFHYSSITTFGLMLMHRAVDLCILYFVVKSCISEQRHVVWIIVSLIVVGFYSALMGFYDHFTGNMSLVALIGVRAGLIWGDVGGRAAGPYLNPALLAMFLGIAAALAYHYAGYARRAVTRMLCLAVIPIMVLSCYWTYTRGGYLVLVLSFLLMVFLAKSGRKRYAVFLLAGILAVVILIPVAMSNKQVRYRLTNDATAKSRIVAAAALINTVKKHPWFGVGLGNGNVEMIKYVESVRDIPGMRIWEGIGTWPKQFELPKHTTSHSTYLTVLADHGIFGALIYVSMYLAFFAHLWHVRQRLPATGLLSANFAALVITLLLGFTLSINTLRVDNHEYVTCAIWILIAATVRLGELLPGEAKGVVGRTVPVKAQAVPA